ncbi:MAG TPA: hypothetical protein VMX16_01650 [Terriglobia bacterium]|nr:hypothetical protein [Terriglobia bacterium]
MDDSVHMVGHYDVLIEPRCGKPDRNLPPRGIHHPPCIVQLHLTINNIAQ